MKRKPHEHHSALFAANALFAWAAVAWLGYLVLSGRRFPLPLSSSLAEDPYPFYGAVAVALAWAALVALAAIPRVARLTAFKRLAVFGPLALAVLLTGLWYFRP